MSSSHSDEAVIIRILSNGIDTSEGEEHEDGQRARNYSVSSNTDASEVEEQPLKTTSELEIAVFQVIQVLQKWKNIL